MTDIFVRQSELGPSSVSLLNGGQTDQVSLVETIDGSRYVFKKYVADIDVNRSRLMQICEWPQSLSAEEQRWLENNAAWPRHLVENASGVVIGTLLPIAPEQFWFKSKDGPAPREGGKLFQLDPDNPVTEYFPDPDLYVLLARLLRSLLWFHERDVAIGDIHMANFLFGESAGSLSPYLIDMDGIWLHGTSAFELTQNFRYAPYGVDLETLTKETDLFKFALVVCKVLGRNSSLLATEVMEDGLVSPSSLLAPSQKHLIDTMLDFGSATAASESDLTKLAEQWEACKTPGGQFVYTSESELPVPYQAGHRLTIHAAEVPAPDSDMRDAPPVHRISRTDAPPRLAMADFEATTTPFAAPSGDGGEANRADQRKPSRKWQPVAVVAALLLAVIGGLFIIPNGLIGEEEPIATVTPTPGLATRPLPTREPSSFVSAFSWDEGTYYDIGGESEPSLEGFGETGGNAGAGEGAFACSTNDSRDTTYRSTIPGEQSIIHVPVEPGQYTYVRFCMEDDPEVTDWRVAISDADPELEQCQNPQNWTHTATPGNGSRMVGLQIDRRCVTGETIGLDITTSSESNSAIQIWGVRVWQGNYRFSELPTVAPAQGDADTSTRQTQVTQAPAGAEQPTSTVQPTEIAAESSAENTVVPPAEPQSDLEPASTTTPTATIGAAETSTTPPAQQQAAREQSSGLLAASASPESSEVPNVATLNTSDLSAYFDIGGENQPVVSGFSSDVIAEEGMCQVGETEDSTARAIEQISDAAYTNVVVRAEPRQQATISLCVEYQSGDAWEIWLGLPRANTADCAGRAYASTDGLVTGINVVQLNIAPECITGETINLVFMNVVGDNVLIYGVLVDQDNADTAAAEAD